MKFKVGDIVYVKYTPGIDDKYIGQIVNINGEYGSKAQVLRLPNSKNRPDFITFSGIIEEDMVFIKHGRI